MFATFAPLVEELQGLVARLDASTYTGEQATELVELFAKAERICAAAKGLLAARAAECHVHELSGHRSPERWLAELAGENVSRARGELEAAQTLAGEPELDAALRSGELSPSQAALIADAVQVAPDAGPRLLRTARKEPNRRLRDACELEKAAARSEEEAEQRYQRLRENRSLRIGYSRDGAVTIMGELAPVDGAKVKAALEHESKRVFDEARRLGSRDGADAYMADALVALCERGLQQHEDDRRKPDHLVVLEVNVESLRRGQVQPGEHCEIRGVGPVPLSTLEELIGRSRARLVVRDGKDVLSVTHLGRTIPAHVASALDARDPVCAVPGCGSSYRLERDHAIEWSQDGPTELWNLRRLCHFHHQLKTHKGFSLEGGPGNWHWVSPRDRDFVENLPPPTGAPDHDVLDDPALGPDLDVDVVAPETPPRWARTPGGRSVACRSCNAAVVIRLEDRAVVGAAHGTAAPTTRCAARLGGRSRTLGRMTSREQQVAPPERVGTDRRRFLQGLGLAGGGLLAGCSAASGSSPRRSPRASLKASTGDIKVGLPPDPSRPIGEDTLPQIEHIVVVMMENHSFDNILGVSGHGDGFTLDPEGKPTNSNPNGKGGRVTAFHMPTPCQFKGKPSQAWTASHEQLDKGTNQGFVTSPSGPVAMGYWTPTDMPFTNSLAKTFPLADRWFCSLLGQTYPNRRYLIAGTSLGQINDTLSFTLPPNGTILHQFHKHGISWNNYVSKAPASIYTWPGLLSLKWVVKHTPSIDEFYSHAAAGTLPSFSLVDPNFNMSSEENPQDIQYGDVFLSKVVNAVMKGPKWKSTLLIWTYDEHGGYYDHVVPPPAPKPDDVKPILEKGDVRGAFNQYGFRVPAGVVSPYAKPGGYVSSTVYDHTSVMKLVETKWNLPSLTKRDAAAVSPLDMVDFDSPPAFLTPPHLSAPADPALRAICLKMGPGKIP
jgi:phospholipase C